MRLDLVSALFLGGLALTEDALRRLQAAGHPDLRISHGYLVQHLVEGPLPIGELAARMEVTQQAASKAVAELERLGYAERAPDPADARIRRAGLTGRGREVVELTRTIRAGIEAELAEVLGADRVEDLRRAAEQALEWAGGAEAVRHRRVPAPR